MDLLELTTDSGLKVYVNPNHIVLIRTRGNNLPGTLVCLSMDRDISVIESVDEVKSALSDITSRVNIF